MFVDLNSGFMAAYPSWIVEINLLESFCYGNFGIRGPFSWFCKWWAICWELRFSRDWIDPAASYMAYSTNKWPGPWRSFWHPVSDMANTNVFAFDESLQIISKYYDSPPFVLEVWDEKESYVLDCWLCWQKPKSIYSWVEKTTGISNIYSLLQPLLYTKSSCHLHCAQSRRDTSAMESDFWQHVIFCCNWWFGARWVWIFGIPLCFWDCYSRVPDSNPKPPGPKTPIDH